MAEPQAEVLSYEQWLAQNGHNFDKLSGMPGWTPEAIDSLKKDQYNRYKMHKGAALPDDAYQYGGQKGGSEFYSKAYGGVSERSLAQQDKFYGQQEQQLANAMEDRGRALEARGGQLTAADLMMARAQGKVPSIAQMQADRQMGQLAAEQTSQAASARGPAALALAQQNQANATATGQSAISGQAQINAAMERERAEQAAFGAYSGMRGQDYQGQQLSQQGQGIALQGAGQAGQQALGYSGLQHSVNTAQLQARGNKQAQESADKWAQASQDAANRARQDAKEAGYLNMVASAGGGIAEFAGSAAKTGKSANDDDLPSDERAKVPIGRSPGIAPQEPYANPSTYEQSRQAAARALDAEEQREAKARAYGTPQTTGPATHGGIAALDRYEQDQVDTLRAKERHGVPLDAKEKRMAEAMKRGQKYGDKRGSAEMREEPQKQTTDKARHADERKEGSSILPALGGAAAGAMKAFAGPTSYTPPQNFYVAPQQQQITSDMGAKRRIGLHDFMSDMGSKLPYSDERAKTNVSFGFGDDDDGAKSRISPSRREAMEEETDANAKWVGLMKNAPGIPTKQGPDAGYGHMFSDMGTKQAPMYSDDRTKLAKAWDQGHAAALSDVQKAAKMPASELKKREGTPAIDTARSLKASAWDEGRSSHSVERAQQATIQAAKKEPGFDVPGSAPSAGDKLLGNISDHGNAALDRVLPDDEPRRLETGRVASRLRARAAAMQSARPESAQLPAGGGGAREYREDEATVFSDERAKKPMSDAEAAKVSSDADRLFGRSGDESLKRDADQEIQNLRRNRPASVRDPMANAARAMEASPYAYKEEFRPPEQAPGEVNVGPMAQKMAKDPVARTAVRQDPQTGLLSLDRDKMLKVLAGTSAAQQKQLDEANRQIAVLKRDGDRPAAVDMKAERLKRDADAEIGRLRADSERGPSVIDRDRPAAPPSWLSKYMDDEEEKGRRGGRLAFNDLIAGRRRKA